MRRFLTLPYPTLHYLTLLSGQEHGVLEDLVCMMTLSSVLKAEERGIGVGGHPCNFVSILAQLL